MLQPSVGPLALSHDLIMFDLDGVIYVSGEAIEGVPQEIARLREVGCHLAFITNNASRPATSVSDNLTALGIAASPDDVVTSAQAAARVLLEQHGAGARILVLGGAGLLHALEEVGLTPVLDATDDEVVGVVSGYGPEVLWKDIMRAAVRIREGLPYVASNTDLTIPTHYGLAPGHGVLVRTLSHFAGVEPVVAGKPSPPLIQETIRRVGGDRPLMVGDRLDTDIEGATNVGIDSLLVLTGVSGLADVVAAPPHARPTWIAPTLAGLFDVHPEVGVTQGRAECGGWSAEVREGRLTVQGHGSLDDWWRAVAVAAWHHLDEVGEPALIEGLDPGSVA